MLFHVDTRVSTERGAAIQKAGGPGPVFAHIGERFRPQSFFFSITERRTFLIVELESASKVAELMLILSSLCGTAPEFTPIAAVEDAASVIGEAMRNAAKAPRVG